MTNQFEVRRTLLCCLVLTRIYTVRTSPYPILPQRGAAMCVLVNPFKTKQKKNISKTQLLILSINQSISTSINQSTGYKQYMCMWVTWRCSSSVTFKWHDNISSRHRGAWRDEKVSFSFDLMWELQEEKNVFSSLQFHLAIDNASGSVMKAGQCQFKQGVFTPTLNYTVHIKGVTLLELFIQQPRTRCLIAGFDRTRKRWIRLFFSYPCTLHAVTEGKNNHKLLCVIKVSYPLNK